MTSKGEITTLLFDFGGTLAFLDYELLANEMSTPERRLTALQLETAEYKLRAALDEMTLAQQAVPSDDASFRRAFGIWLGSLDLPANHIESCWNWFLKTTRESSLWRVVRPGIREALQSFRKAGFKMGIVSNAHGNIEGDANRFGIADYFEAIIDSQVVGVSKPDPRIFQIALERLGSQPQEALFAGDIYSIDMLGAKAAGIRGKLIDAMDSYSWVDHPRIKSIADLPE